MTINVQAYEQIVADSTPGRYEGEQAATAYYHEAEQNGDGDLVGDYAIFEISSEERDAFSFAESETYFAVLIDDNGFIYGGAVTAAEIEKLRADVQSEDPDEPAWPGLDYDTDLLPSSWPGRRGDR